MFHAHVQVIKEHCSLLLPYYQYPYHTRSWLRCRNQAAAITVVVYGNSTLISSISHCLETHYSVVSAEDVSLDTQQFWYLTVLENKNLLFFFTSECTLRKCLSQTCKRKMHFLSNKWLHTNYCALTTKALITHSSLRPGLYRYLYRLIKVYTGTIPPRASTAVKER